MSENENKPSKFAKLSAAIKEHKKQTIIISAIIVAIILLLIILMIVLLNNHKQEIIPDDVVSTETIPESAVEQESVIESSEAESSEEQPSKNVSSVQTEAETQASESKDQSANVPSIAAQKTGYEPLDTLMSKILSNITNSEMTPNAKLNAIYNYVKNNMSYNMFPSNTQGKYDELKALGYSDYDASQMALAYDSAISMEGVCDNYAALTMLLARAAGIPLYQSGGLSSSGSSHAWNILFADGEKYLIDTNYCIYMKCFSGCGYTEQMDGSNYFNEFRTSAPPVEEKKISWMFNAGFGNQRFLGNTRGEVTQTATINRPMYADPGALYPAPITPMIQAEGDNNTFSATISSGGAVIETMENQSGAEQMYYFSWYPPNPGSYVIEITAKSDDVFTGHYIIYADITE